MSWWEGEGRVVNPNKVCLLEFKDEELRVVCGGRKQMTLFSVEFAIRIWVLMWGS